MTMNLDAPLQETLGDRELVHRLVRAIQLDQGVEYMDALEQFHDAIASAAESRQRTLGGILGWLKSSPEDIEANVALLDKRDAAVEARQRELTAPFMGQATRSDGNAVKVLLDQPQATTYDLDNEGSARVSPIQLSTDVGTAMHDPAERERRWQLARRLDPRYSNGDREAFERFDRLALEAGIDEVRTAARNASLNVVRQKTVEFAKQLDDAIEANGDKVQRRKLLEAELAKTVRALSAAQASDEHAAELKLLDEGPARHASAMQLQAAIDETSRRWQALTPEERAPIDAYARLLDQVKLELSGTAAPEVAAVEQPSVPAGRHPGSHALHERVQQRMIELDRGPEQYLVTLEELMAEER